MCKYVEQEQRYGRQKHAAFIVVTVQGLFVWSPTPQEGRKETGRKKGLEWRSGEGPAASLHKTICSVYDMHEMIVGRVFIFEHMFGKYAEYRKKFL